MLFWLPFIIGLLLDRITKLLVIQNMNLLQSIPIIPNFFYITYTYNKGAAFSILQGRTLFLIIVTVFAFAFIGYFLFKTPRQNKFLRFSLGVTTAGIAGNFIDRVRFGQVVDFFDFRFFPIFNIADMCIVIGIILIAFEVLKTDILPGKRNNN